ncbi:hypothetical protein SLS60_003909 [Paraconiothyrium brasiliense]|uniref:RRM domain-containing protein n=1 Tax=Paraconiothyrium brasiliense TaxID=300254 RepID=A0ABR3RPY8_9PLEO
MLDRTQCTLVKMTNMPYDAAPAWIFTNMLGRSPAIKEIELAAGDYYCYVDTPADAQCIVTKFNDHGVLKEYPHAYKVIGVVVVAMAEAPAANIVRLRLIDFLRTEENRPRTKTVQFRGLPRKHPGRAIMEMSEKCFNCSQDLDDDLYLTDDANTDTDPHVVKMEAHDGKALVRFSSKDAAAEMVSEYNGGFWKNRVVYAEFVADSEMDKIIQAKISTGKQTKLFISKVKPGASKEDIRAVFAPYECQDIQMPPGKPFAFVFMYQDAATRFSNALEKLNGKYHDGWFWTIKSDKKSEGKAGPAVPDHKYQVTPASGPVRNDAGATDITYGISHLSVTVRNSISTLNASTSTKISSEGHQALVNGDRDWAFKTEIAYESTVTVPKTSANASNQCDSKASEQRKGQSTPGTANKIRVTGIPRSTTEAQVRKFFDGYPVEEIVLNQGTAMVTMTRQQKAEEAQLVLNNSKRHKLLGKKVTC